METLEAVVAYSSVATVILLVMMFFLGVLYGRSAESERLAYLVRDWASRIGEFDSVLAEEMRETFPALTKEPK